MLMKKLFSVGVVVALFSAPAVRAQRTAQASHPSSNLMEQLLKQNPGLTKGFKTPAGATAHITKSVPGGIELSVENKGIGGSLIVVGPPQVIDLTIVDALLDLVEAAWKKKQGEKSSGNNTCNVTISGNNSGPITINCTVQ